MLDLIAAFDTTEHPIQLQSLEHLIGIKGATLSWFKPYIRSISVS